MRLDKIRIVLTQPIVFRGEGSPSPYVPKDDLEIGWYNPGSVLSFEINGEKFLISKIKLIESLEDLGAI